MDIQKVKATVKKITRLLDQLNDEASAIEKDLVLDYLRAAYDLVLESNYPLPKEDSTIGVTPTEVKPNIQPQREINTPPVPNELNATIQTQREINTPPVPNELNTTIQPQREVTNPAVPNQLNATTQPQREVTNPPVPNELNTTTQPQREVTNPPVPNQLNNTTQPQREVTNPPVPNELNTTIQPQREVTNPPVPNQLNNTTQPQREVTNPPVPNQLNNTTQPQREVTNPPVTSSALLQLFQPLTAHDLSEKLGTQPIRNLKQAFSINDRLLFTNELFDQNTELFADTLKMVDNYESWEPAKSVLLNLATQFHWDKGEKSEIAKQFIKTIQRKFT
jgi:hypothetical protein